MKKNKKKNKEEGEEDDHYAMAGSVLDLISQDPATTAGIAVAVIAVLAGASYVFLSSQKQKPKGTKISPFLCLPKIREKERHESFLIKFFFPLLLLLLLLASIVCEKFIASLLFLLFAFRFS